MEDPVTKVSHIGGPINGQGCATVKIEGMPAARVGDACECMGEGPPNIIVSGSANVFIGGKPAARLGDRCLHGGKITTGSGTVLIGGGKKMYFDSPVPVWEDDEEYDEPPRERKIEIVKSTISDCIALLEERLALLVDEDAETLGSFEKWFGDFTTERKAVIVERMERQLDFFRGLTLQRFYRISNELWYRNMPAFVYAADNFNTIYLGFSFWNTKLLNRYTRAGVLIHEVSHFNHIGATIDHGYNIECEKLSMYYPEDALTNAESYAFFVTGI